MSPVMLIFHFHFPFSKVFLSNKNLPFGSFIITSKKFSYDLLSTKLNFASNASCERSNF
jgi:hypothetical protein